MARINIEESIWSDPRFLKLCVKLGDQFRAVGMIVMAWRLAQEFWCPEKKRIPKRRWADAELPDLLFECGLAEIQDGEIYVRGTAESFSWYFERIDAARRGGKASAEKRRTRTKQRSTSGQPPVDQTLSNGQPPVDQTSTKLKQIQPSSSLSLSLSNTEEEESIGEAAAIALPVIANETGLEPKNQREVEKREHAKKANHFVAAYVRAYQTRFPGSRPEDINDGKVRGQILNFAKEYPSERASQLVQVYFQMDTKWFGTKGYDFLTFRNNLNKIGQALDSGKDPDGNTVDWSKVDLS